MIHPLGLLRTLLAYLPSHTKITITIKFISTSLIVLIRNLLKELMHPNQMHMVHSIFYLFSWQPIFALQVLFFSQKYPILELGFFFFSQTDLFSEYPFFLINFMHK